MTVEERLEAIAISLELTNQTLDNTRQVLNVLAESQVKTEEIVDKLAESQIKTEEMVNKLTLIARSHNTRIANLEGEN